MAKTRSGSGTKTRGNPPGKRFGRGFRSAAQTVRGTLDVVAARQGFAEPDILLRWTEIVGEGYAGLCRPVKVSYGARRAGGGTLVVEALTGRAPEVEHLAPKIVERVNQFYGYRAVGRLKITQTMTAQRTRPGRGVAGAGSGFSEPSTPFAHQSETGTAAYVTESAALAAGIESPGLRDALTRMGAHVLAQNRRSGGAGKDGI